MALDWARVKEHLFLSFIFEVYGQDAKKMPTMEDFENHCLRIFNPPPVEFNAVVSQWLRALNETAKFIISVPENERFKTN